MQFPSQFGPHTHTCIFITYSRSHFRTTRADIMILSRPSQTLTTWTTPSTLHPHPSYIADKPDFDLLETHFRFIGNHFLLHHLDYYILQQNSIRMLTYMQSQLEFWKIIANCIDILQWKLTIHARHLPEHNTLVGHTYR